MSAGENCKTQKPIAFHNGISKLAKIHETFIDLNQNTNNSKISISHQLCFEELWNVEDRGKDNDRQDVACHSCYWARWGRVVPDIIVFNLVLFLILLCLNFCYSDMKQWNYIYFSHCLVPGPVELRLLLLYLTELFLQKGFNLGTKSSSLLIFTKFVSQWVYDCTAPNQKWQRDISKWVHT